MNSKTKISVVIPCYNEEEVIDELLERVLAACRDIEQYQSEIILVDDGSKDKTWEKIESWQKDNPEIRGIRLSRNFGHQSALTCGYAHATGEAIISIDADLQDPPELFTSMLEKWQEGFDIIYMVREQREGESAFKLQTAKIFYSLMNKLSSNLELTANCGDFRLISKRACDKLLQMPEYNRYMRGMVSFLGFKTTEMLYLRHPRHSGETKYPFKKMLAFALDAFCSFSEKPLKLAYILSFSVALPFIIFLVISVITAILGYGEFERGWASLLVSIVAFGSAILFMLGIVGEYIGRIYIEVKNRPQFIVMEDTQHKE